MRGWHPHRPRRRATGLVQRRHARRSTGEEPRAAAVRKPGQGWRVGRAWRAPGSVSSVSASGRDPGITLRGCRGRRRRGARKSSPGLSLQRGMAVARRRAAPKKEVRRRAVPRWCRRCARSCRWRALLRPAGSLPGRPLRQAACAEPPRGASHRAVARPRLERAWRAGLACVAKKNPRHEAGVRNIAASMPAMPAPGRERAGGRSPGANLGGLRDRPCRTRARSAPCPALRLQPADRRIGRTGAVLREKSHGPNASGVSVCEMRADAALASLDSAARALGAEDACT